MSQDGLHRPGNSEDETARPKAEKYERWQMPDKAPRLGDPGSDFDQVCRDPQPCATVPTTASSRAGSEILIFSGRNNPMGFSVWTGNRSAI